MDIKTRFLIISDTHADEWTLKSTSLPPVDVVIHCGGLTEESKLDEDINTSLKLVIAGNHDFTLDVPSFKKKLSETTSEIEPELLKKEFGEVGDAQKLLDKAKDITFLDEGIHQFTLQNGARLTVYASPYTPSIGDWGFQFRPQDGHHFAIEEKVDVVITHGPPKGVLDRTECKQHGGCESLVEAIFQAKPLLHCFGHIHEGWGSKLVTWRDGVLGETPSHFSSIDNGCSFVIETLSSPKISTWMLRRWQFRGSIRTMGTVKQVIALGMSILLNGAYKHLLLHLFKAFRRIRCSYHG
ncbi:Metallo-dependent phosphatase-like protein [Xylariales sp. PMI_506]|nr:Metallo-dependent phosphatase-like protein [Xylariales sp. PMI_506]